MRKRRMATSQPMRKTSLAISEFTDSFDSCESERSSPVSHVRSVSGNPHHEITVDSNSSHNSPGGWNSLIEQNIVSIGEKSLGLRWMHNESIKLYKTKYDNLNYYLRITSSILTFLTTISFFYDNDYYIIIIKVLVGLISMVTFYLTTTLKGENYPDLISKNKNAAYYYSNVYESINQELSYYRCDRKDAKTFYEFINSEFNNLKVTSPEIDEEIMTKFERKFMDSTISKPWELSHINVKRTEHHHQKDQDLESNNPISEWRNNMMSHVADDPPSSEETEDLPIEAQNRRRANTNDPSRIYQIDRFMMNSPNN